MQEMKEKEALLRRNKILQALVLFVSRRTSVDFFHLFRLFPFFSSQTFPSPAVNPGSFNVPKLPPLDPLDCNNICEDVQRFVLQHFTASDFLKISEVCKKWNKQFEGKVLEKTRISGSKMFNNIKTSMKSPKFKQVSLNLDSESGHVFASLFANKVENLAITIENCNKLSLIKFPQVKVLDLKVDSFQVMMDVYPWITNIETKRIEELKLTIADDLGFAKVAFFLRSVANFISRMRSLKKLDLSGCEPETNKKIFGAYGGSRPKFKLEYLKTYSYCYNIYCYDSLKTLVSMDGFRKDMIANILLSYKQLETLEFENCEVEVYYYPDSDDEADNGGFEVNTMIKNLSLKFVVCDEFNPPPFTLLAKKLLAAVPEIETFYVTELTKDLMMFVAANNLKVKQMKYGSIEEGTLEKYEEMCQGGGVVNRDVKFIVVHSEPVELVELVR
jgi:hypothetical protein